MAERDATIRLKAVGFDEAASSTNKIVQRYLDLDKAFKQTSATAIKMGEALKTMAPGAGADEYAAKIKRVQEKALDYGIRAQDLSRFVTAETRGEIEKGEIARQRAANAARDKALDYAAKDFDKKQQVRQKDTYKQGTAEFRQFLKDEKSAAEGPGGLTKKDAAGFGAKMILGHAAGQIGGDIMGDRHGGQEIGSVISAFMFGGPVVGAAVAGMELIGGVIRSARESTAAATKATVEYAASLSQLQGIWGSLVTSQVRQSPFGKSMDEEAKRAGTAASKFRGEAAEIMGKTKGVTFDDYLSQLNWKTGPTSIEMEGKNRQADLESASSEAARKYRREEYPRYVADQQKILAAEQGMYAIETQRPGQLKESAKLTQQIAIDTEKFNAGQRQSKDAAEAGVAEAKARLGLSEQLLHSESDRMRRTKSTDTTQFSVLYGGFSEDKKKYDDAVEAKGRLDAQQAVDSQAFAAENAAKQNKLRADQDLLYEAQQDKGIAAQIRVDKRGYEQKIALREAAFKVERRVAAAQGPIMLAMKEAEQSDARKSDALDARESLDEQLSSIDYAAKQRVYAKKRADAAVTASPDELAKMDREFQQPLIDQYYQTAQAQVRATQTGYAEQQSLRQLAFTKELEDNRNAGAAVIAEIKARHILILAEQDKLNKEMAMKRLAAFDNEAAAFVHAQEMKDLLGQMTPAQAQKIQTGEYDQAGEEAHVRTLLAERQIVPELAAAWLMALKNRAAYTDPAVWKAMQDAAHEEQLANDAQAIRQYQLQTEQAILQAKYEQHQLTTKEYELAKMMAADQSTQQTKEVIAAHQQAVVAANDTEVAKDIMHYRKQGMMDQIELMVKRRQISERSADIERMILQDRRAQESGKAGDAIREEIVALAEAKQKLRDAEIMHVGLGSSSYVRGQVNFRALNQDRAYSDFRRPVGLGQGFAPGQFDPKAMAATDIARDSGKTLQAIADILARIEKAGVN